ncbi:MAG: hypothetical protein JWO31_352, partial [Phycisphaerales bacterium]|nr:hypothetical protein [Phycisphaerales bacterium]
MTQRHQTARRLASSPLVEGKWPAGTPRLGPVNAALVAEFIAGGTDVNADLNHGITPLMGAAREAGPAVARLLLDAGADPRRVTASAESALKNAALAG